MCWVFPLCLPSFRRWLQGLSGRFWSGGVIGVGAYGLFSNGTATDMMFVVAAGMCLVVVCLALAVVVSAASAFAVVMQARAVGYWTRQFDVPAWRGQDDSMPFEMASGGGAKIGGSVKQGNRSQGSRGVSDGQAGSRSGKAVAPRRRAG